MDWTRRTPTTSQIPMMDPRIESPEIKVVYPSTIDTAKEPTTISPTPLAAVPVATLQATTPIINGAPPVIKTTEPQAVTTTDPAQAPSTGKDTWIEILKQNATLFIFIALISFGIGVFAGKKMKS